MDIKSMTNEDLANALKDAGVRVGPITDTTRLVYERKLARLQQDAPPAAAPAEEEEEEEEEEEILAGSVYEEKTTERSNDLSSSKLPRSVTRRSRRGTSPSPPKDISLDTTSQRGSVNRKGSLKKKGKTAKKIPPEEEDGPIEPPPSAIPERVKRTTRRSVQNSVEVEPPEVPKSPPKSKLKSNIPRSSSRPDYANSTVIYPDTNFKARAPRRSFGLSDSFHISPVSSRLESKTEVYSDRKYAEDQHFVTAQKETPQMNGTDSDTSVGNPDTLSDSDCEEHPVDYVPDENPPNGEFPTEQNYDFGEEVDSSELIYEIHEPTKPSDIFSNHIPNKWPASSHVEDQEISSVFKKPELPAPKSSKKKKINYSIWQVDPIEEESIQRGIGEIHTGSADSSVKYDYLPKAFVEKYGKYMNHSSVGRRKDHQSLDSLLFQTHREQAKTSNSNSVARDKPEKLTSAYQRYTSPLASKINAGNNPPPSYIGTPGVGIPDSSRLNTSLNTSLTRRPLREEVKYTSLRNSQAASASAAPPKKKMSIMMKLLVLIVFGIIVWLIYINFESPATKPLLTTNH